MVALATPPSSMCPVPSMTLVISRVPTWLQHVTRYCYTWLYELLPSLPRPPAPPWKGFVPMVLAENLPGEVIMPSLAAGPLVKNITTDLDVALKNISGHFSDTPQLQSLTPSWGSLHTGWRCLTSKWYPPTQP